MTRTALPSLVVEAALGANPGTDYLVFDDTTRGKFDTGTFAIDSPWTDISSYVRSFSVSRGRNRATESWSPGRCSIVLKNTDGRFDPENLSGPYVSGGATYLTPMVRVRVRALWNSTYYPLFQGFADAWNCVYPAERNAAETYLSATDGMKVLGKYEPASASVAVGSGELTGARIGRLLNLAGWPTSDRDIDTGVVTCQSTTLAQNVLTEIQNVEATEYGDFYIDASGRATWRQRYARLTDWRSNTVQATFSDVAADVAAGTAIGYARVDRSGDGDLIRNVVSRQNVGGVLQTVTNSTSSAKYLPTPDNKTDLVANSDVQALQTAQWIAWLFGNWEQRIEAIEVFPQRWPSSAWASVLALELLDRVNVVRTPPGVSAITAKSFVQGIEWSGDPGSWRLGLRLESATYQDGFLIFDSATLGKFDTGKMAA